MTTPQIKQCGTRYFKILNGKRIWLDLPPNGYMCTDGTLWLNPKDEKTS
tara:strand:- start:1024 stop:1170 length:147 start_codon:yes stop_codon:yes gene_type:complete